MSCNTQNAELDIRGLTSTQLRLLGMADLAYVKAVQVNGRFVFAIHAADGTHMATRANQATAYGVIIRHRMRPTLVH